MESIIKNSVVPRVSRTLLIAGARIVVLGTTLLGTGCIIFPVPSFSPEYEKGIIDEATLESLIGLEREEVMRKIGWPDYSDPRGHSYVMVYQGEERYSTDVFVVVGGMGGIGGGKIDDGTTTVLYCQVLELDENELVQRHDVIARAAGITNRNVSDDAVDPIADCSEVVWKPDERKDVLTKSAMSAVLEVQAEAGERVAALALATEFDDLTYLKALAQERDSEATLVLAREFHDLTYLKALAQEHDSEATLVLAREFHDVTSLKVLAQQGDIEAARELVKLTGESTEALRELAESGDLTAATLLARHANELGPLKYLAENGNYEAVHSLAEIFEDGTYVDKLAEEGNYITAYERYQRIWSGSGTALTAWRWLCLAANAGYSRAQTKIGFWHQQNTWTYLDQQTRSQLEGVGVPPDNQLAYVWFAMARTNGAAAAQLPYAGWGASVLTTEEITQAEQMARDWELGACPSAEHRLRVSRYGSE